MNTRGRVPAILLVGLLTLAGAAVYAQLRKGEYKATALGRIVQSTTGENSPGSVYGVSSYPLHPPELEPGDGKAETEAYCSVCHSTRYVTMQPPLPGATWEAEVTKMKKTFGATIPDEAASKITRYLQEHYTPETRKR